MSWLKPMMLMVVLGAILYGVYIVLNKGPAPEPPPGVNRDWAKPVQIQAGTVENNRLAPSSMPIGRGAERPSAAAEFAGSSPSAFSSPQPSDSPGEASPAGASLRGAANSPSAVAPAGSFTLGAPGESAGSPTPWADAPRGEATAGAANGSHTSGPGNAADAQESFTVAVERANSLLAEGKLVAALRKLTKWYDNPQLTSEESRQLGELLGQLAGTVVYSREHLLEPAYKVQPGDRLEKIADRYDVPWQLLAKINGISDPNQLVPGEELKVVRGPFSATVDLDKRQLTLFVENCYAGRFQLVAIGAMARNLAGSFAVADKSLDGQPGHRDGPAAPANSPIRHWISLGNNRWIVGTSDPASIHPGGLNLNARDAEDVYDILSMGSRVTVRR